MASFELVALILTGLGLIVSILYYTFTLQNSNQTQKQQLETRQAQLFMDIYNHWNTPEFWKNFWTIMDLEYTDYDNYIEKYGRHTDPEGYSKIMSLFSFYEGLGVLVKRGLIDPYFVDDLLGGTIVYYWEKMMPIFREMRVRTDYPQVATMIEYLYEVIKPIATAENIELLRKQESTE